ncbi:MAG: acetolactate synthase [Synergistaceae bacterium]
MKLKQISIFIENKPGRLADMVELLRKNEINMRALSIAETTDYGIARLIVDDPEKTSKILKEANYVYSQTPVLAVAISDKPGSLYSVLQLLRDGNINIEYTYAFITRKPDYAYIVFRVDDDKTDEAIDLFKKNKIELVTQEALYNI